MGENQGAFERGKRCRGVAFCLMSLRQHDQKLDRAAGALAGLGGCQQPVEQGNRRRDLVPGDEHPCQGDVLELIQVREIVRDGQAASARPSLSLGQVSLCEIHLCLQRCDRAHIGHRVLDVHPLRGIEQFERRVIVALSLFHAGLRDVPAVRPIHQGRALAQRGGLLPVPGKVLGVVHFMMQQRQSQVVMRRDRLRLRAGLGGQLQRLCIRTLRRTQLALRHLNVGHGESAGDGEDDVADLAHGIYPIIQRTEGGSQVPARPVRELQRDDRLGAAVHIVFGDELLCQRGIPQCVGHVALHLGIVRTGQRDAARQGNERRPVCGTGQRALGVLQVVLAGLRLPGIRKGPAQLHAQQGTRVNHLCGQLLDPAQPGPGLECTLHGWPRLLGDLRRTHDIASCDGVPKRCGQVTMRLIPIAGTLVVARHVHGRLLQPLAQQIRKQPVIAVPLPVVVQRNDEQVGAFEGFQQGLA